MARCGAYHVFLGSLVWCLSNQNGLALVRAPKGTTPCLSPQNRVSIHDAQGPLSRVQLQPLKAHHGLLSLGCVRATWDPWGQPPIPMSGCSCKAKYVARRERRRKQREREATSERACVEMIGDEDMRLSESGLVAAIDLSVVAEGRKKSSTQPTSIPSS